MGQNEFSPMSDEIGAGHSVTSISAEDGPSSPFMLECVPSGHDFEVSESSNPRLLGLEEPSEIASPPLFLQTVTGGPGKRRNLSKVTQDGPQASLGLWGQGSRWLGRPSLALPNDPHLDSESLAPALPAFRNQVVNPEPAATLP